MKWQPCSLTELMWTLLSQERYSYTPHHHRYILPSYLFQSDYTPLFVAAQRGKCEVVELLLSYNASIDKGDIVSYF